MAALALGTRSRFVLRVPTRLVQRASRDAQFPRFHSAPAFEGSASCPAIEHADVEAAAGSGGEAYCSPTPAKGAGMPPPLIDVTVQG